MLNLIARAFDAFIKGFGAAVADIRDKGVFEAFFNLKTPERLGDHDPGWFLGRSDAPDQAIGPPGQGASTSPIDANHKSMSITSGWDFVKEPVREREGQGIDR